jgi:hypothetical protein
MGRWLKGIVAGVALLLGAAAAPAQPAAEVPAALAPWTAWVLDGHEHRRCPFVLGQAPGAAEQHACAWPGLLDLAVDAEGARFTLGWRVLAPSWVPLPGDARHPPLALTVDGRPAPWQWRDGVPMLWLAAGEYRLEGRLDWTRRPERLAVPDAIALLVLRLDGEAVPVPERAGGQLWLGRREVEQAQDSLTLKVFRLLADGVPQRLHTRVQLEVGGRARELVLGPALPPGFVVTALDGPLPAALDGEGRLRVQVRPGTWVLDLHARAVEPIAQFVAATAPEPWPAQEVWSVQSDPGLRVVQPEGARPVDPGQSGSPFDGSLPAFLVDAQGGLALTERSRGRPQAAPHRLTLARTLWLDFDGGGLVARDHITGQLAQGTRLDMAPPWQLERASVDGRDQLLTDAGQGTGVELRHSQLDLAATARLAGWHTVPVAGWRQDFDAAQLSLQLPPGWALAHVAGADDAPAAWTARWRLLDVFLASLLVVLALRALGPLPALVVLAYLLLGYHSWGAPLWTLVVLLVLALVRTWLPAGRLDRLATVAAGLAFVAAVLVALPFVAGELRLALYPQLEQDRVLSTGEASQRRYRTGADVAMPQAVLMEAPAESAEATLDRVEVTGSRVMQAPMAPPPPPAPAPEPPPALDTYPADTVLQAGQGDPDWHWHRVDITLSGPVSRDQDLRLWLSPPWLTRLGRLVLVGLLGWLLWRLRPGQDARALFQGLRWPRRRRVAGAAAVPALLLMVVGALQPPPAVAQPAGMPTPELLAELRERLLRPPPCVPDCARLDRAEVELDGRRLRLRLDFDAAADVLVPLPEGGRLSAPVALRVGGTLVPVLRRDGQAWLRLQPGRQQVELELALAAGDAVDLRFPLPPGRIAVRAPGWDVAGLEGLRLQGDSLQLSRQRVATPADGADVGDIAAGVEAPVFVQVERTVHLGLDWTVSTRVLRVAPAAAGFSVTVPLLPGERVHDDRLEVVDGQVRLAFSRGEQQLAWRSSLPVTPQLRLEAPSLAQRAERWQVVVGPFWRVAFAGTPALAVADPGSTWSFAPFPGEHLALDVTRPPAVAGDSLAIDRAHLRVTGNRRLTESRLTYLVRATRAGQQTLRLPDDADLLSVSIDDRIHQLLPEDGVLTLPVLPGSRRVELVFRQAEGVGAWWRSPALDLGAPLANLDLEMAPPEGRWLLWVQGRGVGPAVLYWPYLIVLLAVAVALARTGLTPLGTGAWLLLGLGFSTVSWQAGALVAAWLLVLGWRGRQADLARHRAFVLVQVGLVLLTAAALLTLVGAIPVALLGQPEMYVAGNGSSAGLLRWFFDRAADAVPQAAVLSVPMWLYQLAILAWALWLANALLGWLRWGWGCLGTGGLWPPPQPRPIDGEAEPQTSEPAPTP